MRNALEVMDQNQVWEALKARYYRVWLKLDPAEWPTLLAKVQMVDELRAEMRGITNSGDMDNARSTGAE